MDRTIVWVMICTLISNSAYAMIAPFLPIEFVDKGISESSIGLIFAIYSVAVIIFSPIVGKTVSCLGSTNMIASGTCIMGITFILFGFIDDMSDVSMIYLYGLVLRFI